MINHESGKPTHDIDTLSEWIERISHDFQAQPQRTLSFSHFRSRRTLKRLSRLSTGGGEGSTEDCLRLLIAAGILTWIRKAKENQVLGGTARPDLGTLATFALWPVVIAPFLPLEVVAPTPTSATCTFRG